MNSKERVATALHRAEIPDQVPLQFDLCRSLLEDFGKKYGIPVHYTTSYFEDVTYRISANELRIALGSDCVIVGGSLPSGYRHPVTEDGCIVNEFGMKMRQGPLYMEVIQAPLANVSSVGEVEKFSFPDPLAAGRFDDAKKYIEKYKEDYFIIGDLELTIYEMSWHMVGMEKFMNIASRAGDLKPSVVVVVATIKALKRHAGVKYRDLKEPNPEKVKEGLPILANEIDNVKKYGLRPVVCMNHFYTDSEDEIQIVLDWAKSEGVPAAFTDTVLKGGSGGLDLAKLVLEECEKPSDFHFLYDLDMTVEEKIRAIATKMYKVSDIELNSEARKNLRQIEKLGFDKMPICMAKTPLSLTDNDRIQGMPPEGYILPIVRLKPSTGVGFIVAYCGDISTMPAHPSKPAANDMDIDEDGVIKGLS